MRIITNGPRIPVSINGGNTICKIAIAEAIDILQQGVTVSMLIHDSWTSAQLAIINGHLAAYHGGAFLEVVETAIPRPMIVE